jgi:hypothetical protein
MSAVCLAVPISVSLTVGTAVTTTAGTTSYWQELVILALASEMVRRPYTILTADRLASNSCLLKDDNKICDL